MILAWSSARETCVQSRRSKLQEGCDYDLWQCLGHKKALL